MVSCSTIKCLWYYYLSTIFLLVLLELNDFLNDFLCINVEPVRLTTLVC